MPLRCIHVVSSGRISSLLWLNNILFIHPLMNTSSFHVSGVVNNVAMNTAGLLFLFPLGVFPEVALLGHMVVLI